jgi:GTP-binding protein
LDPPLAEIAMIGRSNVGKSSLLNVLLGRPGIARVSGTPGKTRALNVFQLPRFYLVDLPGYGYAKADKATRAAIRGMLGGYLRDRSRIAGVIWLLDIRHQPSNDDELVFAELAERQHPILAVLTKADKLASAARRTRSREIARAIGLADDQVQVTSSSTGLGVADLGTSILQLIRERK